MSIKKILLTALVAIATTTGIYASNKDTKVWLYGFALSFNDSTVYLTDIQQVDSAAIVTRAKFLYSRENYSYQLRDYLKGIGCQNPTCITTFAVKQKDIEKKYINLKKRFSNGKFTIKHVTPNEFKYLPIPLDQDDSKQLTKAERKALKKKAKQEHKEAMKNKPKGGKGPGNGHGGQPPIDGQPPMDGQGGMPPMR